MTRFYNWQERMIEAINARRDTSFAWGSHDCALFACDIAEAVCGIDFAKSFREKYNTEKEAYQTLKQFAGGGIEQVAEKIAKDHGCKEVPVLMAQQGDIILAKVLIVGETLSDSLGICLGERAAFANKKGFVQLPITCARRAWRTP